MNPIWVSAISAVVAGSVYLLQKGVERLIYRGEPSPVISHIREPDYRIARIVVDNMWLIAGLSTYVLFPQKSRLIFRIGIAAGVCFLRYLCAYRYPSLFKRISPIAFTKAPEPVPERWSDDPILKQFSCAIGHTPVREAVKDPQAMELYDRRTIMQWVISRPISPLTRRYMCWTHVVTHRLYAVQGVIDYRIQQREEREKALNGPIPEDGDAAWVKESATQLDQQIARLFTTSIKEQNEIPPFFRSYPGIMRCAITGKPIRHLAAPNVSLEALKKDRGLLDIVYEASALKKYQESRIGETPPRWPVDLCPLPIQPKDVSEDSRQWTTEESLQLAIDELRCYYQCFSIALSPMNPSENLFYQRCQKARQPVVAGCL